MQAEKVAATSGKLIIPFTFFFHLLRAHRWQDLRNSRGRQSILEARPLKLLKGNYRGARPIIALCLCQPLLLLLSESGGEASLSEHRAKDRFGMLPNTVRTYVILALFQLLACE